MEQILKYINNYFAITKEIGKFNIIDGSITVKGKYLTGQYIFVKGSILNDGVYRINNTSDNIITLIGADNEEFEGVIYGLAIPKEIVALNSELEQKELEEDSTPIYQSESFGNYSYTLATNEEGQAMTPFDSIKPKLKRYRQIYETSLGKAKEVK